MCHLILLFPVVGVLLFWVLPFYIALPGNFNTFGFNLCENYERNA